MPICLQDVLQLKVEEEEKPPDDDEEPDPDEPFNFKIWSEPPPEIEDPFSLSGGRLPMIIEPEEAIVSWLSMNRKVGRGIGMTGINRACFVGNS